MKRNFSIILIIMFVFVTSTTVYCSWLTIGAVAIKRVAARSAIYNTATAGANVPMQLAVKAGENLTAGGSAWVNVLLPGSTLCKVGGVAACAGAAYLTDMAWDSLMEWCGTGGEYALTEDGTLTKTESVYQAHHDYFYNPCLGQRIPSPWAGQDWEIIGVESDLTAAFNAIHAIIDGYATHRGPYAYYGDKPTMEGSPLPNQVVIYGNGTKMIYGDYFYNGEWSNQWVCFVCPYWDWYDITRNATPADVEDTLNGSFDTELWPAVQDGLQALDTYYNNQYMIPTAYWDDMDTIDSEIRDCISAANLTAVENAVPATEAEWLADVAADEVVDVGVLTPEQVKTAVERALAARGISDADIQAAIEAALVNKQALFEAAEGVTAAQIETAINNALIEQGMTATTIGAAIATALDDADVPSVPDAPEIGVPDKESLTESLTGFMDDLGNLDILDALDTVDIEEVGATSVLSINYPDFDGGYDTAQIDFSGVSTELAMIGDILLSIISIIWIIWLFKD